MKRKLMHSQVIVEVIIRRTVRESLDSISIVLGDLAGIHDRWKVDLVDTTKSMPTRDKSWISSSQS